jgi:hypothetical protein
LSYSYESEFLQKFVKDKKMHETRAFNFTYMYIDDVLSINNSRFAEYLPLIYPSARRGAQFVPIGTKNEIDHVVRTGNLLRVHTFLLAKCKLRS